MAEIPIHGGHFAIVDDEFTSIVAPYKWYLVRGKCDCTYVQGYKSGPEERVLMHRLIMGSPAKLHIDHRNKNGLDNRLSNLRVATPSQNLSNRKSHKNSSSRFLGVTYHKKANKWVAHICKHGKYQYLGLFIEEREAALAYNMAAIEVHKEFANLNVIS